MTSDALRGEKVDLGLGGERPLSRGTPRGSTASHARTFPQGRLIEEREAIAVQALAGLGRPDDARSRAEAFRRAFPHSFFLPLVDNATR